MARSDLFGCMFVFMYIYFNSESYGYKRFSSLARSEVHEVQPN